MDQWSYVYVFDVRNYTNQHMKALRMHFKYNGQFSCPKVKPTMLALGSNASNEYRENLHFVSQALKTKARGQHRGLFFCNNGPEEVLPFMRRHRVASFAKTGFVATRDYIIRKGVLTMFAFCQEVQLKRLGLPVLLKRGKLLLNQDYVVCEKGQPLRPEQSKLLELLGLKMARFEITIYGYWNGEKYQQCFDEFNALSTDDEADSEVDVEDMKEGIDNLQVEKQEIGSIDEASFVME